MRLLFSCFVILVSISSAIAQTENNTSNNDKGLTNVLERTRELNSHPKAFEGPADLCKQFPSLPQCLTLGGEKSKIK